ncbi:hypothetical protein [Photorhabdus temperata]|uniref:hypothetical protein n=1 Tax=Photorhabdus temperata TaxID=574560 RepID=UPI000411EE40|nr:hypothetical protein [Photorhabdus temperata]
MLTLSDNEKGTITSQGASETESKVTESLLSMALAAPVRASKADNLAYFFHQ